MHKLNILILSILPWVFAIIEGSPIKFHLEGVTVIPIIGIVYTHLALFVPKRFLMGTSKYTNKFKRVSVNDIPGILMAISYCMLLIYLIRIGLKPTLPVAIVQSMLLANLLSYTSYTIFNIVKGVTEDDR